VDAQTGIITTVAGNGTKAMLVTMARATSASLNLPQGISVDDAGNLYIADTGNNRIRKVDAQTGIITTLPEAARAFRGTATNLPGKIYSREASGESHSFRGFGSKGTITGGGCAGRMNIRELSRHIPSAST